MISNIISSEEAWEVHYAINRQMEPPQLILRSELINTLPSCLAEISSPA